MKNLILKPSKEWHANATLSGEKYEDVIDLPVTRIGNMHDFEGVLSVWKVPFWKRILFLFDGRINFSCMGKTHPPISITVGDYFDNGHTLIDATEECKASKE